MFGFRRKTPHKAPAEFHFSSTSGAFEMACKYMHSELGAGKSVVALVLDARELKGTTHPVKREESGAQTALLKVASPEGGFEVLARTLRDSGPDLAPGMLVIWTAVEFSREMSAMAGDPRFGWVGVIESVVLPVFHPEKGWKVQSLC